MTRLEQVVGAERVAPTAVRQRLRNIEPAAELIYVGNGKWWVGRMEPHTDLARAGQQKVRAANRLTAQREVSPETAMLYRVGRLQQEGFRMLAEYEGDPDGRMVQDLEVADYLWRAHATFQRWQAAMESGTEEEKAKAKADLLSYDRAKDAWNYMFKGTFAATRTERTGPKSGHTRLVSV